MEVYAALVVEVRDQLLMLSLEWVSVMCMFGLSPFLW